MSRMFGTVVRGVRAPIFREGDDVVKGTVDTVLKALKENGVLYFSVHRGDRDGIYHGRYFHRGTMPRWSRSLPMSEHAPEARP